jgi:hypothetical protein
VRSVLLLVLIALVGEPAHAVLCRTRTKAVFSRTECRKKETAIDPASIGGAIKGEPGAAGTAPARLRAVDANGQRLPGIVNANGFYVHVVGTRLFRIDLGLEGFPTNRGLFFDAAQCAGQPLVRTSTEFFDTLAVRGTTAFMAGDPIVSRTIVSQEFPTSPSTCTGLGGTYTLATGLCCFPDPMTADAGPATPIDLSAFVPPFHLEAEE